MDTRNKRASAIGFALAALVVQPEADSAIGQADRQHVAFSYAGILAGALNVVDATADYVIVVKGQARTIVVPEPRTVIVK